MAIVFSEVVIALLECFILENTKVMFYPSIGDVFGVIPVFLVHEYVERKQRENRLLEHHVFSTKRKQVVSTMKGM